MTDPESIKIFILRFTRKLKRDRVSASAAESAYFVIMGFVPFFMLLLTLIQYTKTTPEMMMSILVELLPESFYYIIAGIVEDLFTKSPAILSGTVIAAVWATSRGVLAITSGLNSIRGVRENRNYFYMRARSGVFLIFLVGAIFMSMMVLLFGNRIQALLTDLLPDVTGKTEMIVSIRATSAIVILALIFLALYCALPNCKLSMIRQVPGAVLAAVTWAILSYGFSIYFTYFMTASSIYGSLTTVIMLMLWLYFCMWLLFLGAEVNCYLEYPDAFQSDEIL